MKFAFCFKSVFGVSIHKNIPIDNTYIHWLNRSYKNLMSQNANIERIMFLWASKKMYPVLLCNSINLLIKVHWNICRKIKMWLEATIAISVNYNGGMIANLSRFVAYFFSLFFSISFSWFHRHWLTDWIAQMHILCVSISCWTSDWFIIPEATINATLKHRYGYK